MDTNVTIKNGALDELADGTIVLRGRLDPSSMQFINADNSYQREVLPSPSLERLMQAIAKGEKVPDVTLGMRGQAYSDSKGTWNLKDAVYVIDGLQRIASAIQGMKAGLNSNPHLGSIVYFGTDRDSEAALFKILNTTQAKLSPNILVRNLKEHNAGIELLYQLSLDRSFALYDRISWQQRMRRKELITAMTLLRVAARLHSAFGSGRSSQLDELAPAFQRLTQNTVGRASMRHNLVEFFEIIDQAFSIRTVAYKESAVHLRQNFMMALADLMSEHKTFWDDNRRLAMSPDLRKKLASFPINDPEVRRLASGGSTVRSALKTLLLEHLNSGKRTRRLVPFKPSDVETPARHKNVEPDSREAVAS